MAGTLFGLPLSQQMDANGDPLSGCLLYIYQALTTTPADVFTDSGLSTFTAFPIEADASGRIPQFWLNDGSYRARLTTAGGVEVFDHDSILAIGPSAASTGGGGGGGGGGGTVDASTVAITGDVKWRPVTGILLGWVRANARTIGSASSGATERASSDTQALYEFLWNNFSNTLCPVTTGRGATALADFAANKAIGTLDMRGYGMYGLDDMGNTAAGRLTVGSPTTAGSSTGAEKTTLSTANLPSHTHDGGTLSAAAHTHPAGTLAAASHTHDAGTFAVGTAITNGTNIVRGSALSAVNAGGAPFGITNNGDAQAGVTISLTNGAVTGTSAGATAAITGSTAASSSASVTGTSASTGSGTAATTISPGRLGSFYIKL
jgi:hypothetical protein